MKSRITRSKLATALFALFAFFVIGSCQKDPSSDKAEHNWLKIASWYQSKNKVSVENPFSNLKPDWRTVRVKEDKNMIVYEIDLKSHNDVMLFMNRGKIVSPELEKAKHAIKLIVFENKLKAKIMYGAYMSIESTTSSPKSVHYKEFSNLSGTILYHHFNGKFANGWEYSQGRVTKQLVGISKEEYESQVTVKQGGKMAGMVCTSGFVQKYVFGCSGGGATMVCGYHYNSTQYITRCEWKEEDTTIDHLEEEPGLYFPDVYVDCDGVEDGEAYFVSECGECIGGTTGKTVCTVLDTTNHVTNPCLNDAMNIALGKNVNSKIKSLMTNTFLANSNVDLDFYSYAFNPNGSNANADAITTAASTTNLLSQSIALNETKLLGASKEYVVATIYHEVLHAYLANLFPAKPNGGFLIPNDHQYIVDNFLTTLIADLRSQFPNLSESDAWGLAWGGLEQDSPRYELLTPQAKQQIVDANNAYKNKPPVNGTPSGVSKGKYCP